MHSGPQCHLTEIFVVSTSTVLDLVPVVYNLILNTGQVSTTALGSSGGLTMHFERKTRLTRSARPAFGQVFRACSTHDLDSTSTIPPPRAPVVDATMLLLQS